MRKKEENQEKKTFETKKRGSESMHRPLEALGLGRQQVLDVSTSSEDALEVDPLSLDVDPHIKERMHTVQLVLPAGRLLLKHAIVRRTLHGSELVDVLLDLVEQVVPPLDQLCLVLVVHKL